MLGIFLRFSGIGAMICAWIFVVFPAWHFGIDSAKETISSATLRDRKIERTVGFGLVAGAFLQMVFLFYISSYFSLNYSNIGCIFYLTANIATMLVAFFTYRKYPAVHKFLTRYYFFVMPISLVLIGFSAGNFLLFFSLAIFILYLLGAVFLYLMHKDYNILMQSWSFGMLSMWTLVVTFLIL